MSGEALRALCPECGGVLRSGCCADCGCSVEVRASGARGGQGDAHAETAWVFAARATLAFLAVQLTLRGAVMMQSQGNAWLHLTTAALGTGVTLAVHRALTHRNEAVLQVWMGVTAAGALLLAVGTGLWWTLGTPGVAALALAFVAAVLTAGYAWVLYRVLKVVGG